MVPDAEYKKVQDLFTMLNAWAPRLNQKFPKTPKPHNPIFKYIK